MNYPNMLHSQPLTKKEQDQVNKWETAADPFERMLNPYYPLMRQWLTNEYIEETNGTTDLDEQRTVKEDYLRKMQQLTKDYETDLDLCIEMMQTVNRSFSFR